MEPTYSPNPPQSNQSPLRRYWIWIVAVLVLLIGLVVFLQIKSQANTGALIITTNSNNNVINVTPTSPTTNNAGQVKPLPTNSKTYKSGHTIRLTPGSYFINVSAGEIAASQIVTITAHQTSQYAINLPATLPTIDPLGDVNARQFNVSASAIYYIDNHSKTLNKIDSANRLSQVGNQTFASMQWADANYGLAQDNSGNLFVISNSSVTPITDMPVRSSSANVVYAVAPNHDIYLAVDNNVYRQTASGFKLIYSADTSTLTLSAANDQLLVVQAYSQSSGKEQTIVTIDKTGTVTKRDNGGLDTFAYGWSPDGNHLFSVSEGASLLYSHDLTPIAFVPTTLPTAFVWADANTIYFAENGQIWQYNTKTQAGKVIANTAGGQTVVSMQLSPDGSTLYLATQSSSNGSIYYSLYRYSLTGQPAPAAVSQLHNQLPWLQDSCFLSLVDFTQPTVEVVQSHPTDGCIDVAKNYVKSFGIDPNSFNYQLSDVLPTTPSPSN